MRKLLFILILAIILFGFWQSVKAVDVLIDYPPIEGAQSPNETSDLPNLINYIYKFSLLACGIVAFISILFGAIQYVTSAGNASKAGDAKDRITQALWGILILLAAVVILRTINPDLINLNISLENIPNVNTGGTSFDCRCIDRNGNEREYYMGCKIFKSKAICRNEWCGVVCSEKGPTYIGVCSPLLNCNQ